MFCYGSWECRSRVLSRYPSFNNLVPGIVCMTVFSPDIEFHFVSGSPASDGGRQIRKVGEGIGGRRRNRGRRWNRRQNSGRRNRREVYWCNSPSQAHGISDTMWQMYRPLAYRYCYMRLNIYSVIVSLPSALCSLPCPAP